MGRQWNPEEINDSPDLNPGVYAAKCIELKEDTANEKLIYKASFEVTEPAEFHGQKQSITFWIGQDDDKLAEDPKTWSRADNYGAKDLKRMFKALRVPQLNDLDQMCAQAVGNICVFSVVQTPKKDANKNAIPGEFYSNVRGWKEFGSVDVNQANAGGGSKPKPTTSAQAVGKTGASVAKVEKPKTVKCPECDKDVPKAEWLAHAATHDDTDE